MDGTAMASERRKSDLSPATVVRVLREFFGDRAERYAQDKIDRDVAAGELESAAHWQQVLKALDAERSGRSDRSPFAEEKSRQS